MKAFRTDEHSPKHFEPGEYSYLDSIYIGPYPWKNNPETLRMIAEQGFNGNFKNKRTCDHCGAYFHYGAVFAHEPSNEVIVVGHICADEAFGCADRRSYDLKRLRNRVAAERAREAVREQAAAFLEANPGLAEALESDHHIVRDIGGRLFQYGSLSPKQVALIFKISREQVERAARDAARQAALGSAPGWENGRQDIEGRIVSFKGQEGPYGYVTKMLVECADGRRIWGTAPQSLFDAANASGSELRNATVRFSAKVEVSKDDRHFGFFSRPTKAEVVQWAAAAEAA